MASLSFDATRIRTPTLLYHKPISIFTSLIKPVKISYCFFKKPSPIELKLDLFRSESSVSTPKEVEVDDEEDDPTAELCFLDPEIDPGSVSEWELDFCSRPILDIRGKKVWELVVCDSSLSLQYTKYFPNNVINSVTLKDAIVSISDYLGVPLPEKIRFFRWIITRYSMPNFVCVGACVGGWDCVFASILINICNKRLIVGLKVTDADNYNKSL